MDPEQPTHRLFKNGDFIPETRPTQEEINQNKIVIGEKFQNGGCFGNGPGIYVIDF